LVIFLPEKEKGGKKVRPGIMPLMRLATSKRGKKGKKLPEAGTFSLFFFQEREKMALARQAEKRRGEAVESL